MKPLVPRLRLSVPRLRLLWLALRLRSFARARWVLEYELEESTERDRGRRKPFRGNQNMDGTEE